jgi:serine/threonine-protein kinase RsbW
VNSDPDAQGIVLELPADTQHLRLARLVAAGVAAPAGLGVDDVDDLRIAVDELCATLIEAGTSGPLRLTFAFADGQVEVTGRVRAQRTLDHGDRRMVLSNEILSVVADEHELATEGDHLTFRLLKRRAEARTGTAG